jgi:hypothetical protein
MGVLLSLANNLSHDKLDFHQSLSGVGLLPDPQAPLDFKNWVQALCDDWDFETLCTAHNGVLQTGANRRVRELLGAKTRRLIDLSKRNAARLARFEETGSVDGLYANDQQAVTDSALGSWMPVAYQDDDHLDPYAFECG